MDLEDLTQLLQVLRIHERHAPSISQVLQGRNTPACLSIGVRRKLLHYCTVASTPLAAWIGLPSPRRQEQELLHRMYCVAEPATHLSQHVNGASVQPYVQASNNKQTGSTEPGLFKSMSLWARAAKQDSTFEGSSHLLSSSPVTNNQSQDEKPVQPQRTTKHPAPDTGRATTHMREHSNHKGSHAATEQAWHCLQAPAAAAVIEDSMRDAMIALAAAELAEAEARVMALRARLANLTSGAQQ